MGGLGEVCLQLLIHSVDLREARLNEAASRQTLSRVRWRQCV